MLLRRIGCHQRDVAVAVHHHDRGTAGWRVADPTQHRDMTVPEGSRPDHGLTRGEVHAVSQRIDIEQRGTAAIVLRHVYLQALRDS